MSVSLKHQAKLPCVLQRLCRRTMAWKCEITPMCAVQPICYGLRTCRRRTAGGAWRRGGGGCAPTSTAAAARCGRPPCTPACRAKPSLRLLSGPTALQALYSLVSRHSWPSVHSFPKLIHCHHKKCTINISIHSSVCISKSHTRLCVQVFVCPSIDSFTHAFGCSW